MTKNRHYHCIVAWAEGKEIQVLRNNIMWETIKTPCWSEHSEYRIKPTPKSPGQLLYEAWNPSSVQPPVVNEVWEIMANRFLKAFKNETTT